MRYPKNVKGAKTGYEELSELRKVIDLARDRLYDSIERTSGPTTLDNVISSIKKGVGEAYIFDLKTLCLDERGLNSMCAIMPSEIIEEIINYKESERKTVQQHRKSNFG